MTQKKNEILSLWAELFIAHPLAIKKVEEKMGNKAMLAIDEYDLLLTISREENKKCRLNLLAEKTLYTKSGVTRVTNRMIEKGYITKEQCKNDKRGSYASLTQNGIKALKQTWEIYSNAIIESIEPCLDTSDTINLRRLLAKLVDRLRNDNLIQINPKKNKS